MSGSLTLSLSRGADPDCYRKWMKTEAESVADVPSIHQARLRKHSHSAR
jgi:hypothetical protein